MEQSETFPRFCVQKSAIRCHARIKPIETHYVNAILTLSLSPVRSQGQETRPLYRNRGTYVVEIVERYRKFRAGGLRRGQARHGTASRVIDTCRSAAASVLVNVPLVYIYTSRRATVSGHRLVVGVAARMMTRLLRPCLVSIAIIRRKSEERLAAGARKRT